jgi:DNA-binding transcriptional MerR regulator
MLEVALWPLLLGLVLFGLLPGASLRLIVRIYPKGNPRRRELVAELYKIDYQKRLFFVAQNLELALFEGLPARWKSRRRPNGAGADALMPPAAGYRGPQVCKIAGITYRQLDYWVRTELIRPSIADASAPQRRYSYTDILELKLIKQLLDSGVSLRVLRKAITFLRQQEGDIGTSNLLLAGGRSALVRSEEELQRLARQVGGVLSVVPLARVKDEVDDAILSLRRPHRPLEGDQPSDVGRHRQTGGEG